MNPIKVLILQCEGQFYPFTPEDLKAKELSEEEAQAFLSTRGTAQWHKIYVVEPFSAKHATEVETRCLETDEKTGERFINSALRPDACIEVAVTNWTLNTIKPEWLPTREGMQSLSMPLGLAQTLRALVMQSCYGGVTPDFFGGLTEWRKSATTPSSETVGEAPSA